MNGPAAISAFHAELIEQYRNEFNKDIVSYEPMTAHGSDREIIRIGDASGQTAIGIFNSNIAENRAFIGFGRHFREQGKNVPHIYSISDDSQYYLLEDLGDVTLLNRIKQNTAGKFSSEETALYKRAIDELLEFQLSAGADIDYSLCYQFNCFGNDNIDFDLNYFKERFLMNFYDGHFEEDRLLADFAELKRKIMEMPAEHFLYRDYQSRNIMLKDDKLWFIDFQSGRKGPLLYDLVSLLYDARANVPQQTRELLAEYYIDSLSGKEKTDKNEFGHYFWYFAVMRILQAMGAYGYLGIFKGKKKFLESVPYALKNINYILKEKIESGSLSYLRKVFTDLINEKA